MKRLLRLIHRHRRPLAAGAPILLVAAVAAVGLRSAGSAHAQAPSPAAAAALPGASLAPPAQPHPVAVTLTTHRTTSAHTRSRHLSARRAIRHGVPTPAPSNHGVALALKQTTGLSPSEVSVRDLCPSAATDHARCAGEALVLRSNGSLVHPRVAARRSLARVRPSRIRSASVAAAAPPLADTPAYLQQAYDLSYLSQTAGSGDTVAIVDAYNDPSAASDLSAYRSAYGLPACPLGTSANSCLRMVNENGGSTLPASTDDGWDQEISLDLDTVSAICPHCSILLVEANSSSGSDMLTAMQTAANLGAKQISDSWTMTAGFEPSGQYTFPGVATVAATGDAGYLAPGEDNYPAAMPGVTAAGGTTLAAASSAPSARGFGEAAWSGGGSGCDLNVGKPAYQADTGCAGRSYADLSADANPATGLAVYDDGSWLLVGGTSLATPMIAAYYAITGVTNSTPQWAYADSAALNDVVSGSNGSCASTVSYLCNAGAGYDGPTGVGSISGSAVTGAPGIGGPAVTSASSSTDTYTESVASHSATIAGGIYRNGLDTTWWIQYGTSTQYGSQTPALDLGAGSAPVAVTGYLSELAPNTTYHYRLVAHNSLGTTDGYDYTFTTLAAPAGAPTASFTVTPSAPSPNSAVTLDATGSLPGSGTIAQYTWNFGDGSVAQTTTPTVTHTFTARGTDTVSLTVTNTAAESDTSTQAVTVDSPPTAAFTPSVPVSAPDSVSLDATSSAAATGGSITDYSWNFGDGTTQDTGTTATAAHTYANPGTYTITLTATDDLDVSNTATQVVTVGAFTANDTQPQPGTEVTFSAADPTGITGYSWNFGDPGSLDNTSILSAPSHSYSQPGRYTVTLTTTNSAGLSATSAETITVDNPPTASLPSSPIIAAPGTAVTFDGSASAAALPALIKTYTWNFGDGSAPVSSSSPSISHVYNSPNTYYATLTVTDNLDVTGPVAATQTVIVDQPAPAFTPSATTLAPGATATLDAGGSSDPVGTITDYSWNFGDGTMLDTYTTPSASHSYSRRGSYTIALSVTNSYGQTATTKRTVTVDDPPTAAFTPSATSATAGSAITFSAGASTAMSGGSIADYSWSFGDGSSYDAAATAATAHTYSAPGTYTVTLTTTDDLGMSSTASEQVTIQAPPAASVPSPPVSPAPAPGPSPAPAPSPSPAPAPVHAPAAPRPLAARLGAAHKQRLAPALAHGLRLRLAVSQGTRASFQITLPVPQSKLAARRPRTASLVLLRTRVQALGVGTHAITLKLSRAAARELAGRGPLVLTVRVTLTEANRATVTRWVKITLTR